MPVVHAVVDAPLPSIPPSAPALQQLVRALGMRESDLLDHVSELVCMPRYLAYCAADLPPNLTEIGMCAFNMCTSLSEITLPLNLTEIGKHAFNECTSLRVITLPAGPVDVGEDAFYNCPGTPRRVGN